MRRKQKTATETFASSFAIAKDSSGLAKNEFEGLASVFNVPIESWMPTLVEPGAFRKTLQERADKVKVLWQHDPMEPIGVPTLLEETPLGLKVRGRISETDTGKKALILIRDGVVDSLSIGFDPVIVDSVKHDREWYERVKLTGIYDPLILDQLFNGETWRHIRELKLFEFSPVTFPANSSAMIRAVHSVVPFQDLPMADEQRAWSRSEADARVRTWAGGGEKLDDMDWAKYRRAFLWYDGEAVDKVTSYKLQIGDIIDGKLTAVPRAIFACAVVLAGGRGGVNIPDDEADSVKAHLGRYYKKMDRTPPWEDEEEEDSFRIMLEPLASVPREAHEGRVLSTKNKKLVSDAISALQALLEAAEPPDEDKSAQGTSKQALTVEAERLSRLREAEIAYAQTQLQNQQ